MKRNRKNRPSGLLLGAVLLVAGTSTRADVGPPAVIKMPRDTPQATSGQEYNGKFLVHVFKAGTLDRFQLAGEG